MARKKRLEKRIQKRERKLKKKRPFLALLLLIIPFLPWLAAWLAKKEGEMKGYDVEQFKLTTRDGTKLSAVAYVPHGEGPFPALVMVHSWMLSRWQCHLYAPYFASNGYVVLSYDCRGWGSSKGQVQCACPEHEINDLEDAIDWLTEKSGLPLKEGALGVTGISYGGGHSFMIAGRDERVRAVAPMCGWTDLNKSLTPQNSVKILWGLALMIGASWATKLNPSNILYRWVTTVLLKRDELESYQDDMGCRSVLEKAEEVKCPMLIVGAWNDELFEPNQMMDYYQRLNAPKMLYISNGLHGLPEPGVGPRLWGKDIWELTRRWFDYWLKGEDNGILSEPSVRLYKPWMGRVDSESDWPPPDLEFHDVYLRRANGEYRMSSKHSGEKETVRIQPSLLTPTSSGPTLVCPKAFGIPIPGPRREAGKGYFSFSTTPSKKDYEVLGIPRLRLAFRPLSEKTQINALLYDVPPQGLPKLITHGTVTLEYLVPGEEKTVEVELIATDHLLKEGHSLRLTLSGMNLPFVLPVLGEGVEILYGDGESRMQIPLRAVKTG
jgi:predicted acyl esterase